MSDPNTIDILEPGHPGYDTADFTAVDVNSRDFYDGVAHAYNTGLEIGAIAFIPLPAKIRPYNFRKCITGRGLEQGIDVLMVKAHTDASGRVLSTGEKIVKMKKLSDTKIRRVGTE